MRSPIELQRAWLADDRIQLDLQLPQDLFWFRGHFERFHILPGVAQVDWALRYGQEAFGITTDFQGMDQVKFQSPVRPDETLQLVLHWHPGPRLLDFVFERRRAGQGQPVSRGRFRFATGDGV
jgi:3-hydroxymyristoyl/3-hydroxydecanoyl-(acyl carrier protein) dehydratase